MTEPDYIVIRGASSLPEGFLPEDMDGRWYDRSQVPLGPSQGGGATSKATAVPTGRFEYREDGAVAEVWEVRP